jgi:hypothetical protein
MSISVCIWIICVFYEDLGDVNAFLTWSGWWDLSLELIPANSGDQGVGEDRQTASLLHLPCPPLPCPALTAGQMLINEQQQSRIQRLGEVQAYSSLQAFRVPTISARMQNTQETEVAMGSLEGQDWR